MKDPFKNYDAWLQSGNPADDPEDEMCETCGTAMVWEDNVDIDEDTGRARLCGGSWTCPSRSCGSTTEPPEAEE
jgi:hypothetical protein